MADTSGPTRPDAPVEAPEHPDPEGIASASRSCLVLLGLLIALVLFLCIVLAIRLIF